MLAVQHVITGRGLSYPCVYGAIPVLPLWGEESNMLLVQEHDKGRGHSALGTYPCCDVRERSATMWLFEEGKSDVLLLCITESSFTL
jgi:hypothetical protein